MSLLDKEKKTNIAVSVFFKCSSLKWGEKCPHQSTISWLRDKVDFFISHLEMNEDIKMHKFPALNINKNANGTLWVLIMQGTSFLLFSKETFQERS